jgi:2-succinyl-6-hydroxy-2,4-cyclohexadiene-1-carboxylate synthase
LLVDAGGVRLHVEVRGAGRPLILLHGFTGSSAVWDGVMADLAADRRVFAFDLLGHGASDAPDEPSAYAMDACVGQLRAACDRLGVLRADWLGYSMGGRVALALALSAPDRVRKLVLESASPGIADPGERAARRAADEALADRIAKEGMEPFVDAWMDQPLFASQRRFGPVKWAQARARRLAQRPQGMMGSLRGVGQGAQEPLWDRLSEVQAPTLLLSGALDGRYGGLMGRMAAAMSTAGRVVVADAGHAVHAEQPAAWLEAVRSFLDEP